jgi:Lipopolysaccharide-assembly
LKDRAKPMSGISKLVHRSQIALLLLLAGVAFMLPSCDWDGNFVVLGCSTASQFDKKYHTIRVPIFKNLTLYPRLEFDLTRAVVAEIERRTHLKVVECDADLELTGKIMLVQKNVILGSPVNEVRNAEITMGVDVVLKDLRTGKILSKPPRRPGTVTPEEVPLLRDNPALQSLNLSGTGAPAAPGSMDQDANMGGPAGQTSPPPDMLAGTPRPTFGSDDEPVDPKAKPQGLRISATGGYIPEMGQSTTTAEQTITNRMANQIVNMMEMGW